MYTLRNLLKTIRNESDIFTAKDTNILFVDVTSILLDKFSDEFNIGLNTRQGLIRAISQHLLTNVITYIRPLDVVYYIFDGTPHAYRSYSARLLVHRNPHFINLINNSSFLDNLYVELENTSSKTGVRTVIISKASQPGEVSEKIRLYMDKLSGGEYFLTNVGVVSGRTDVLSVCLVNSLFNISVFDTIETTQYDMDKLRLILVNEMLKSRNQNIDVQTLKEREIMDLMLDLSFILSLYDSRSNPSVENLVIPENSSWKRKDDGKYEDFNIRALFIFVRNTVQMYEDGILNIDKFVSNVIQITKFLRSLELNLHGSKYPDKDTSVSIITNKYLQDYTIPGFDTLDIPGDILHELKIRHFNKMYQDMIKCLYLNCLLSGGKLENTPDFLYNSLGITKEESSQIYSVLYPTIAALNLKEYNIQLSGMIKKSIESIRYDKYLLNIQYVVLVSSRESSGLNGQEYVRKIISEHVVHPINRYYLIQYQQVPMPLVSEIRKAIGNIQITEDWLRKYQNSSAVKITVSMGQYISTISQQKKTLKMINEQYGGRKDETIKIPQPKSVMIGSLAPKSGKKTSRPQIFSGEFSKKPNISGYTG